MASLFGIARVSKASSDDEMLRGTSTAPVAELSPTRRRVLVVDDQETIRELIALYLEDEHFEVQEAGSGPEALLRFMNGSWDLVITDRMMPEMTGDELADSIRRMNGTIPIILVSGFTAEGMGTFEFDAVVHKPFTKEALLGAINRISELGNQQRLR